MARHLIISLQFAINDRYTVDSSHDTVVINATQMGNNSISYADIKDGLKDASQIYGCCELFRAIHAF